MDIDISAISLDIQNFRHKKVSTEREAITELLSDEKEHKIAELAQDIIDMKGLDPSSRLIVGEDILNKNQYIALEGNRRITALKTLINPDLAINLPTHSIFRELHKQFISLNISQVDCVVLNREDAYQWIKRKHYNAMGGKGTIEWNAIATAKADASEGRPPRWMIALSAIAAQGDDADTLLAGVASKTTTVERVFGTAQFTPILGISFDQKLNTIVAENGNQAAAANLLKTMLLDMADRSFTVGAVENAPAQTEFVKKYAHLNVKKVAAKTATSSTNGASSSSSSNSSGAEGHNGSSSTNAGGSATGSGSGDSTSRAKPARSRKVLAEKGLRINNGALNKLYNELRKLNVENNAHIGSAMIRIFVEKATMVFLEDMSVNCPNPSGWRDYGVKLKDKVAAALAVIDPKKKDRELDYARDIANGTKTHAHSLDQLNRAIHDHKALPAPSELVIVWDRLHHYFQQLFKTLADNGK